MYPVCLNIKDQLCVVVGGGAVAERKVFSLLAAGAQVRVVSPELSEGLAGLSAQGRIEWLASGYRQGDLANALLVFAATDNKEVQDAVIRDAERTGKLVNVADAPEKCSFQVPAVVRQGDLTIAVSTNGSSPAVAAKIKKQLEKSYGPEYAVLLELMAQLRGQVLACTEECGQRKILFQNILHDDILQWIRTGQWELLRSHLGALLGPDIEFDISQPGNER